MRLSNAQRVTRNGASVAAAVIGIVLLAAVSARAVDEKNLVFYCSFDKEFDADWSAGPAKPVKVVGEPKIVAGKFGQALEVVARKNGLVFASGGNLPQSDKAGLSSRGTLSFWMMPADWDIGSAKNLWFGVFETQPQQQRGLMSVCTQWPHQGMQIYAWNQFDPGNRDPLPAGGWPECGSAGVSLRGGTEGDATMMLRPGTWYHLVFTWRGGQMSAYVNGRPGGKLPHGEVNLAQLGDRFFIGAGDWEPVLFCDVGCSKLPGAVAGRETPWRYLVDEFAVFDTVLQPSQVLKLYENTEGARAYAKAGDVSGTCILETYSYISREKLDVNLTCDQKTEVLKGAKARLEIRKKGQSDAAALQTAAIPWNENAERFQGEVDTAGLPREVMEVRAVVADSAGTELARSDTQRYNRTAPVWLGNNYGKGDYVPAPWTPLKANREKTEVWGRTYTYGDDLTLTGAKSRHAELLAGPMRLWAKEKKQRHEFKRDERSQDIAATGTRDTRVNTGKLGSFPAVVKAVTEFDGFVIWELDVSPDGDKPIDELILEIPLSREHAKYFYTVCRRDAQVPTNTISGMFPYDYGFSSGGYTFHVQFNDAKVGFQWTMDSAEHWSNVDKHKQINVVPRDGEVAIQLRMIDKPTVLKKTAKYRFFVEALPVKPLSHPFGNEPWPFLDTENKLAWDFKVPAVRQEGFTYEGCQPGVRLEGWSHPGGSFGGFCFSTDPTPEEIAKCVWKPGDKPKLVPASGQYAGGYHFMGTVWSCDTHKPGFPLTQEADVYGTEWAMQFGIKPPRVSWGFIQACPNEAFNDHFAFWVHHWMMSGNSTIYYDHGGFVKCCVNTGHGHGWKDEKGLIQPHIMVLETRRLQMRAYKAMKEVRPYNRMTTHIAGERCMGIAAFTDNVYDTETISAWSDRVKARADAGGYWSASLPWDWMMAQFYPPVLGVSLSFGPMLGGPDLRPEMLSQPNVPYYNDPPRNHVPHHFKVKRHIQRDLGALSRHQGNFPSSSPSYPIELARRFVCADEQKAFVGQGELKIAYWPVKEAGSRLLVTAANFEFQDLEKDIAVDVGQILHEAGEASFACPADGEIAVAWDTETGELVPLTGKNRLQLKVGKKDYRDFEITFVRPKEEPAIVPPAMSESDTQDWGIKLDLWKDGLRPEFQKLADKRDSYLYDYPLVPRIVKLKREIVREARAKAFQEGDPAAAFGLDQAFYAWPQKSPAPYYRWAITEAKKAVKHDEQKAFGGLDGLKVIYWTAGDERVIATISNLGTEDLEREITVDTEQLVKEAGQANLPLDPKRHVFDLAYDVETGDAFPVANENSFKVKVGKKDYRNLCLSWKGRPQEAAKPVEKK